MLHLLPRRNRKRGQILVLFELLLVVIIGFAALVIDLGVLRNNKQILVNTLDAAALAGGSSLPVDGTLPSSDPHSLQSVQAFITKSIAKNYPGLVLNTDYTITYKCLIGADAATGAPLITRDIPGVCDPHNALNHPSPPPYAVASDFTGAGPTRVSNCRPDLGDKCNVVVVTGSAKTNYALAPVLGVQQGNTGTVVSAACKGACGAAQVVPVDLVIILDRTYSMNNSGNTSGAKIQALQAAATTVLSVYDPAKQRVALALTGPGAVDASGNPASGSCPAGGTALGVADDQNFSPTTTLAGGSTTLATTAPTTLNAPRTTLSAAAASTTLNTAINSTSSTSIKVNGTSGFPGVPFYIQIDSEQMKVTTVAGTTWTVARGQNGTTAATHSSGATVTYLAVLPTATTITVASAAGFPSVPFYVKVDAEQMKVTTVAGTTLTVTRGQNGTTAAAHGNGTNVTFAVDSTITTIYVASKTGFPTVYPFTVKIDSEQFSVIGSPTGTSWSVQRGQGGTTAVAHNDLATVTWDVDNADTIVFVASAAGFPATGNYSIKIGSEEMLVTGGQGTTRWTVARHQDGTTAAAYAGGAAVTKVVGSTDTVIQVNEPYGPDFPSTPFTIAVGTGGSNYEHMLVTNTAGSSAPYTWTVTRGQANGVAATTHSSGDTVDGVDPWVPSAATDGVWIPVGLSGTDTVIPLPNPNGLNGTYSIGGVVQTGTPLVKSINCIQAASIGTNLTTPIQMAQWYLDHYGRPGVTQGIILETDGHPQVGFESGDQTTTNTAYTCQAALAAATAAKADTTNSPDGIQFFTIGYGVDSSAVCPTRTSTLTDSNNNDSIYESPAWSNQPATTLLSQMATDSNHYFENPPTSQLAAVFTQAATILAKGGAHLIQLYPPPIVSSAIGAVATVAISGQYFTGASKVSFGGTDAISFSVSGDSTITAHAPAKPSGTVVDVVVTTPGGISPIRTADHYTYP
jgi:hypothetical protein